MNRGGMTIKEALRVPSRLSYVQQRLLSSRTRSRTTLAESLCRRFGFRDPRGELQVSSCLKALRGLEGEGLLTLPARQSKVPGPWTPRRLETAVAEPEGVPESVEEVRGLRLQLVSPRDEKAVRTWNELIVREHPQGERRLVGKQLRYLVKSAHGVLGAIGFSAAALQLGDRDAWIGWSQRERLHFLDRVVCLSRFLIRPGIRCRNLASKVLAVCLRRVSGDFEERYGNEPWLLESFVDTDAHLGTCFQAANWQRIGQSKGRGRNDRKHRRRESVKDIYVYPLVADFRGLMGLSPDAGRYLRPRSVEQGLGADEWAEQEFGDVELGDKRLRDRLIRIASDRAKKPDASYLEAVGGNKAAIKGYYHFVDRRRDGFTPEDILAGHRDRTVERAMTEKTVLVAQDTTDLNFATRHHTAGLSQIGTNQTGAKSLGLKLHSSLVLTTEGVPLGVLKSDCFEADKSDSRPAVKRPIEEKTSFRWIENLRECVRAAKQAPDTHFISVMDREGDIFELFQEAIPHARRVGILVRASHNRRLVPSEGKPDKLFDRLKASSNRASIESVIPRQRWKKPKSGKPEQKAVPERPATLTVRWEEAVEIQPPRHVADKSPVTLSAVFAREEDPPDGAKQIEWILLTTEPVKTAQDAARMVEYYTVRWRIEEWHRVLKTGCRVQEHQHDTAKRLERVIAIDAVLAWRIQLLTLLGREVPELPCDVFLDEWEIKVLEAVEMEKGERGRKGPFTLAVAIILIAMQGGYMARKSDPPPGSKVIWKGMIQLVGMAAGFRLATMIRDGPRHPT